MRWTRWPMTLSATVGEQLKSDSGILLALGTCMVLSAEALDIIAYLQTAPNKFVSLLEISRRAGGRRRFEEAPNWARNLMTPLVEAGMLEVNARGHYRVPVTTPREAKAQAPAKSRPRAATKPVSKIVGDDYFPAAQPAPRIVGGDYFPGD